MTKGNQGKFAEFMALQYLRLKGYSLVACNYITGRGTGAGEVDIIVKNQTSLVFIEVKKRKDLTTAYYAIQPKQQQRIRRGAEAFLAHHPEYQNFDIRFDAILVEFPFKIEHIENAF
ncbi:MAG: YraN family protein [Alphaproteobacteria bacterium]|nr:YraN family protein [Alphaproteobacteria bacterium]